MGMVTPPITSRRPAPGHARPSPRRCGNPSLFLRMASLRLGERGCCAPHWQPAALATKPARVPPCGAAAPGAPGGQQSLRVVTWKFCAPPGTRRGRRPRPRWRWPRRWRPRKARRPARQQHTEAEHLRRLRQPFVAAVHGAPRARRPGRRWRSSGVGQGWASRPPTRRGRRRSAVDLRHGDQAARAASCTSTQSSLPGMARQTIGAFQAPRIALPARPAPTAARAGQNRAGCQKIIARRHGATSVPPGRADTAGESRQRVQHHGLTWPNHASGTAAPAGSGRRLLLARLEPYPRKGPAASSPGPTPPRRRPGKCAGTGRSCAGILESTGKPCPEPPVADPSAAPGDPNAQGQGKGRRGRNRHLPRLPPVAPPPFLPASTSARSQAKAGPLRAIVTADASHARRLIDEMANLRPSCAAIDLFP